MIFREIYDNMNDIMMTGVFRGRSNIDFIAEFSRVIIGRELLCRRPGGTWSRRHRFISVLLLDHPRSGQTTRRRTTGSAQHRHCLCPGTPRPCSRLPGPWAWPPLPAVGMQGMQKEEHERRPAQGTKTNTTKTFIR